MLYLVYVMFIHLLQNFLAIFMLVLRYSVIAPKNMDFRNIKEINRGTMANPRKVATT